jgi:hypothetical protein
MLQWSLRNPDPGIPDLLVARTILGQLKRSNLKLYIPCTFRSMYSIYYTNQMHIISYIWVLNT